MLLKKIYKNIPSLRHKKMIKIYNKNYICISNIYKKKNLFNNSLIIRKKIFNKNKNTRNPSINIKLLKNYDNVVSNYYYTKQPYKMFIELKSIFNMKCYIPGIKFLNIGDIINTIRSRDLDYRFYGMFCKLEFIPFETNLCYINNKYNNKLTFCKSSGSICTKKQAQKKIKFIFIVLPSLTNYYLPKHCKAFIGDYINFKLQNLVEGKWGYSLKKSKKINVRGVAMNPVDHPNGGRAKSCQPERNPWGFVAKFNK